MTSIKIFLAGKMIAVILNARGPGVTKNHTRENPTITGADFETTQEIQVVDIMHFEIVNMLLS